MKPKAKPVSLFAPRRVPIPLREQGLKELNRMESLGIISKVDTPTPWCAGMVLVPKPNGTIRICVDLKPLNECVLREIYPLPNMDDILAQLTGAAVFSKLDANCGFWQIPLEPLLRSMLWHDLACFYVLIIHVLGMHVLELSIDYLSISLCV